MEENKGNQNDERSGLLTEKARLRLEETRARLAFDPAADPGGNLAATFVANLTTQNLEVAAAVIRDHIRSAKRKLFGLAVENLVVPIIVGNQGVGKTMNVDRLTSPLWDYRLHLDNVASLSDSRWYKKFEDNYVGVIDELTPWGPTGISALQNFITTPVLQVRVSGTHELKAFPNNITIIGTSNYQVKDKHRATAKHRRLYGIRVDKEIDRQTSESISYEKLWRGINENGPSPLLPYLPLLG